MLRVAAGATRGAALARSQRKAPAAAARGQRRFKQNVHYEEWDGYRSDVHKRFEVTRNNIGSILMLGLGVPALIGYACYYHEVENGHRDNYERLLEESKINTARERVVRKEWEDARA